MQFQNFDLNRIKQLSPIEAKQYLDKYLIPLTDGNHAELVDGKYELRDDSVIKRTYFNRMSKELHTYYFKEKTDLKTITYDFNKPIIFGNYLNLCPEIKQKYKKIDEFSQESKVKLELILIYIKEVLCSNNVAAYEFLLKWISNMFHGNRNYSALYLKGLQGAGKSTLLEFIREHVLGNSLCFQGGSSPLKSKFNSELSGKLMVVFEELENFSSSEWISISSVLKRQITSPTLMIEKKGIDPREEKNLNNYILISNNDAIQDDDGRRYFILDINTKYFGDKDYFDKLYTCFTDEVGQLFYSYIMDISVDGFNPQAYPMTKSKQDSFSKRLDSVYKFLKDVFVLQMNDIKRQSVQELYNCYVSYCEKFKIPKIKNKIDFNNSMSDVNIKCKKSHGQNVYNVSYTELKAISDKFHWVHELDEITNKRNAPDDTDDDENQDDPYEFGIDKSNKSIDIKPEKKPIDKYFTVSINNRHNSDGIIEKKVIQFCWSKALESFKDDEQDNGTLDEKPKKVSKKQVKSVPFNWSKALKLISEEESDNETSDERPKKVKNSVKKCVVEVSKGVFVDQNTNKRYKIAKDPIFDGKLF